MLIQPYAIYDNFLDDPSAVIRSLRSQRYYVQGLPDTGQVSNNDIPLEINYGDESVTGDPRFGSPYWKGYRTRDLQEIDMDSYNIIMSKLLEHIFGSFTLAQIEFDAETHFHLMTKDFVFTDTWFHSDASKFIAGVLYLAEDPGPNSGTALMINGEKVSIENKFNRLIVYNAGLTHSAEGCFGDSLENCRATFVFFIRNILLFNDILEQQEPTSMGNQHNYIGGY
jgi:hypothetical protein